jgi:hypothetical protein
LVGNTESMAYIIDVVTHNTGYIGMVCIEFAYGTGVSSTGRPVSKWWGA